MSESFSPPARPAKRQRTDGDLRRQRKREADRMAQKNSRERRRSHIDHLENTISILRKDNGNAAVCELMELVRQLREENERLRKIINNARTSLSLTACELSPSTPNPSAESNILKRVRESSPRRPRVEPPPPNKDPEDAEPGELPTIDATLNIGPAVSNTQLQNTSRGGDGHFGAVANGSNGISGSVVQFTDSWMDEMPAVRGARNVPSLDPYSWLGLFSLSSPGMAVGVARCPIWERSNNIYSQISKVTPAVAAGALQLTSAHYADMIFKAVVNGWGALNGQERSNPIMRTLRDIDQVFPRLDSASRAAFMYKSHMLLRYHMDPKHRNVEDMPEWQRPSASQRTKQHPIAVDFFVWPALRERLIDNNHSYFATSDFGAHFSRYYKFHWPYSFEDTYVYDSAADTYRITPIFERYHRNIKYWGVEKPFLERFPELVHDITVCDSPESSLDNMEYGSGDTAADNRAFADSFIGGDISELFNDFPHVG